MQFDLTALTASQLALLTVAITALGVITAATLSAISAVVTVSINARSARRLDYLKVAREAKAKQLRMFKHSLAVRLKLFMVLRNGLSPAEAKKLVPQGSIPDQGEPVFLPLFLAGDPYAANLIDLANAQQKLVKAITPKPDPDKPLSDDAIKEVNKLVHTLILLSHFIESFSLRDTADPTGHMFRLRGEALNFLRDKYPPYTRPNVRHVFRQRDTWAMLVATVLFSTAGYSFAGIGGVFIGPFVAIPLTFLLATPYLDLMWRIRLIGALVFVVIGWVVFRTWGWRPF
jgi:hypothetical protein